MQEFQPLTPDAQVFARVWKRVMPDESLSQIVVHGPQETKGRPPVPPPAPPRGDREVLRELLTLLDECRRGAGEIVRRQPGARPMKESLDRSAAQLRSAWYLLIGERWQSRDVGGKGREPLPRLLREQYFRELQFAQLCRQGEQSVRDEDLRELLPEMEEESKKRRRMLRNLLSRS